MAFFLLTTGESLLPADQLADSGNLIGGYGQGTMFSLDPEFQAASDVILSRYPGFVVMHSNIQQMNPLLVGVIVPSDVCSGPLGLHYDRYSVELLVARMKYVSSHESNRCAAELVERGSEVRRYCLGSTAFDLMAVDEMHDLTIPEQRH
jgi:hypothetical protein